MKNKLPKVVIAAGATLDTAMLPGRLLELAGRYGVQLYAALSHEALEFVTLTALAAITSHPVYHENSQFDPASGLPMHRVLRECDLLVLYPASARILAQCALGEVTCPVTRLFAFTPKDRVLIAPAIHPDMSRELYDPHVKRLSGLGCKVLAAADLWANWRDVEDAIVDRLKLSRLKAAPADLYLDKLTG